MPTANFPFNYLSPHGIEEKAQATTRFLQRKMEEFDTIKQQIEELKQEVSGEN